MRACQQTYTLCQFVDFIDMHVSSIYFLKSSFADGDQIKLVLMNAYKLKKIIIQLA